MATPANPAPLPGASLSDLLSAAKNLVIAINNLAQNYLNIQGVACTAPLNTTTLVKASAGRCVAVSVIIAGDTTGYVVNSNSISSLSARLCVIQNTVGIQLINLPAGQGIVFQPGTNMYAVVSYS